MPRIGTQRGSPLLRIGEIPHLWRGIAAGSWDRYGHDPPSPETNGQPRGFIPHRQWGTSSIVAQDDDERKRWARLGYGSLPGTPPGGAGNHLEAVRNGKTAAPSQVRTQGPSHLCQDASDSRRSSVFWRHDAISAHCPLRSRSQQTCSGGQRSQPTSHLLPGIVGFQHGCRWGQIRQHQRPAIAEGNRHGHRRCHGPAGPLGHVFQVWFECCQT
mmetsp:Transcript_17594/g.43893  ORF Transcript_17594/g.43893 Transcript_17594/m.43893 type:complete len:214 (+) Transcript_17594:3378-4019(+)